MLMLPMVLSDKDVEEYVGYVNGRTKSLYNGRKPHKLLLALMIFLP